MTALDQDADITKKYGERFLVVPAKDDAVAYVGSLLAVTALGLGVPAANTAGLTVLGRCTQGGDNENGGDGGINFVCEKGVFGYAATAALAALTGSDGKSNTMIGRKVYVKDDATVGIASDASNLVVAGILEEVDGDTYYVAVGLGEEYSGSVSGDDVATVANENVIGGVPVVHVFEIADAATADYDITLTEKTEFYDFVFIKTGAAGVAVTCQMKNTATAITDAVDLADADKTISRPATIDDASNVVAAGGILRASIVRTTSGAGVKIIALGFKRA